MEWVGRLLRLEKLSSRQSHRDKANKRWEIDRVELNLRSPAKTRHAERPPALGGTGFTAHLYALARTWPTRIDQSIPKAL